LVFFTGTVCKFSPGGFLSFTVLAVDSFTSAVDSHVGLELSVVKYTCNAGCSLSFSHTSRTTVHPMSLSELVPGWSSASRISSPEHVCSFCRSPRPASNIRWVHKSASSLQCGKSFERHVSCRVVATARSSCPLSFFFFCCFDFPIGEVAAFRSAPR